MKNFIIKCLLLLVLLSLSVFGLMACGDGSNNNQNSTPPEEPPQHVCEFGEWVANNDGTHTKTCKTNNAHLLTENCSGGIATCTQKAECGVCGQLYGDFGAHKYSVLRLDASHHWYECECGEAQLKTQHIYTEDICTCGFLKPTPDHVCIFEELKYNTTTHWYECSCGAQNGVENHSGGTATCQQKPVCATCSQTYGTFGYHKYSISKSDEYYHWSECVCGSKAYMRNHTIVYDNSVFYAGYDYGYIYEYSDKKVSKMFSEGVLTWVSSPCLSGGKFGVARGQCSECSNEADIEIYKKGHSFAVGVEVEYTSDNKIEYAIAKDYISKSIFLSADNAQVVCGKDIDATLICSDCKQSMEIVLFREHLLDTEHSRPANQTCLGTSYSTKYCAYADCENKYVDGITDTPYEYKVLNARHNFVFDKIEGGKLYVNCTNTYCPYKNTAVEISTYAMEETVKNLECADYAAGKTNYNTITFKHTIDGNEEEYTVIQKLAVKAHKYGVTVGMIVDLRTTPNAVEIIKASYLCDYSPAQDCLHTADYSFICPDCNQSVAIEVKGDHINADGSCCS